MKQNLWILNSSLLLILLLTVLTNYYLEQQPPKIKFIEKPIEQVAEKKNFHLLILNVYTKMIFLELMPLQLRNQLNKVL